jgi:hypothetical protein
MIDFIARLDRAIQDAHSLLLDRPLEPGDECEMSYAESCRTARFEFRADWRLFQVNMSAEAGEMEKIKWRPKKILDVCHPESCLRR